MLSAIAGPITWSVVLRPVDADCRLNKPGGLLSTLQLRSVSFLGRPLDCSVIAPAFNMPDPQQVLPIVNEM
jgi:hypothetical protein